jgi:hypothetical protein
MTSPNISWFGRAKLPLRPDIWAARPRRPTNKQEPAGFETRATLRFKSRAISTLTRRYYQKPWNYKNLP